MTAVALQSFGFGDQLVRAVERNGVAWFIAADVCAAVDIANAGNAVSRLEDDERDTIHTTDSIGRRKEMVIISESGVYALVFTSRKESAKRFRRWVTQEVLPAIRTTGRYEVATENDNKPQPARILDLEGALGTADDRHAIKTALMTINTYTALYGQQAGRDMLKKLGFPVPGIDLPPSGPATGAAMVSGPVEGDLHQWATAAGLKGSTRDATHVRELYGHYSRWCSKVGAVPMHPTRFKDMVVMLFNHEEHPEMIKAVVTR